MRLLLHCLLACLLLVGPVFADDRNPSKASTAEQVLAAWREGKTYKLVALARQDDPDPWVVADDLCQLGEQAAALAFARAAVRQDTARLAEYLERRGKREVDAEVRAAVDAARKAKTKEQIEAALEKLEAVLGRGDEYEQVLIETGRGNKLNALERHEEAAQAFLSAGRLAERLGWLSVAARVYEISGMCAYEGSNQDAMLRAWEGRLGVEQGRENDPGIAEALMFVGLVYVELGDYEEGMRRLKESLAAHEALGNDDGVAWVLNNLATLHSRRGEHHLEQAALERALRLSRKVGNKFREASVLCDQGATYSTLHEHERAREVLEESIALYRELDYEEGVIQCMGTIGETYSQEGNYDRAIEYFDKVLPYYRKTKNSEFLCAVLNSVGYVHLKKGDLDRAQKFEEEAVAVGDQLPDPWWGVHARQSLADVLIAKKKLKEAKRYLDGSLIAGRKLAAPVLMMVAHRGLAQVWLEQKKYARAVHEATLALEHSQAILSGLAHAQAASAREQASELYDIHTRAAVAWGKADAVFTAMESARAGALLEVLENRAVIHAVMIPDALRTRERKAKLAALAALRHYQKALKETDLREVRKRRAVLDNARQKVNRVVGQIQRTAKSPASVLYPMAAPLDDVQRELSASETMVLYSLIGEQALAFVVTKKTAKTVSLGSRDAIVAAAGTRPDDPAEDPAASVADLRAKLIEPLGLPKDTGRLLISPDGVLGFTPFSLLVPGVEVVYIPSGTAYRVLRGQREQSGKGVLALGDPDYRVQIQQEPKIAVRGGMRLVPLPGTRKEAEGIGDVVLLGKGATKSAFLAALTQRRRWEAVHLACHGLVDPERPSRTALALAFEADGSNLLRFDEVFTRDIPADLTVLSACETGKGQVYRTEGIVGLAQAFMLAGSPRVLVSLWKVDDQATQALMLKFYDLWRPKSGKPGVSAAAALKAAQAHVRTQKKWEHPCYWAAWVLWGLP